ncbi:MAG: hypothetical protein QOI20_2677 [Acidimicrobiaceae bacterium]|nr:hypothetical protein [Acidimicrobiaceae bacterium]
MTRERRTVFGEAAALYDRRRPTYPPEAVDHILAAAPIGATDVIDIGCGTGKASVLFADRGLRVVGVEPDPAMAAVAATAAGRIDVAVTEFEHWDGPPDSADIALAAQSWHWIDPAAALPKLARVLRPNGVLAVMANTPRDGGLDLHDALDPVYAEFAPELLKESVVTRWPVQNDEQRRTIAESGLFDLLGDEWHHDWEDRLSAQAYAELIQTHSDHRMLDPDALAGLAAGVGRVIDERGGVITMLYRTTVTLARRRRSEG